MVVSAGYFLSSRRQCQNSTAAPVAEQRECARGHCVGLGICHAWQRSGTVHVGSQSSCEDLVTRSHGIWAYEGGNVVLAAACLGGVHIGGDASGASSPQATEVGVCWVV